MCPRDDSDGDPGGDGARTILMDLESANTFLAGVDLAFMFATFWPRAVRQEDQRERRCLMRYHQRLGQRGIGAFGFDQLFDDYRVAIAMMIFYPIWDKVIGGSNRSYWWPKMQCLCDAYEDLNCRELVG